MNWHGSSEFEQGDQCVLISIVTICLNANNSIFRCINSVRAACRGHSIEHVIVDGGSTDGTLEILHAYASNNPMVRLISEPDHGISDAFNKGLRLARGRFVHFLNADDWLAPGAINHMLAAVIIAKEKIISFDAWYHFEDEVRSVRSNPAGLMWEMTITHPAVLVDREAAVRSGGFDLKLKYAMDFDLLLRMIRADTRISHYPVTIVNMAMGGVSDRRWRAALWECYFSVRRFSGVRPLLYWYYLFKVLRGCASRYKGSKALGSLVALYKRQFSMTKSERVDWHEG